MQLARGHAGKLRRLVLALAQARALRAMRRRVPVAAARMAGLLKLMEEQATKPCDPEAGKPSALLHLP